MQQAYREAMKLANQLCFPLYALRCELPDHQKSKEAKGEKRK